MAPLASAKTLSIAAKEDVEKEEYAYAQIQMNGQQFIEAYKTAPTKNKELLSKAIKNTLDDMENINSKLKEQPKKQKTGRYYHWPKDPRRHL